MTSQNLFQSHRFSGIVQMRRGSVCIDIINVLRRNSGILQRKLHARSAAFSLRCGSRDVIRIAVCTVSDDFRKDLRSPLLRVLLLFEDQNAGPLSHHKAASVRIKRNACPVRIVASAECLHGRKSADSKRCDRRLGTSADHHLLIAVPDSVKRIADGIVSTRTCGDRAGAHSPQAIIDGNSGCRHVGDCHRNKERADLLKALFHSADMLLFNDRESSDSAGNDHAGIHAAFLYILCILSGVRNSPDACHLQCLRRCIEGKLGESCHPKRLSFVQPYGRVKIFHLCCQLHAKIRSVKQCNRANAVLSLTDFAPALFHAVSKGIHGSDSCHHNLFFHQLSPSYLSPPLTCRRLRQEPVP